MPCSTLDSLIFTVCSSTRDQHIVECTHPAAVIRRNHDQLFYIHSSKHIIMHGSFPSTVQSNVPPPPTPTPTPLCPSKFTTLTLTVTFCIGSPMNPVVKDYHTPTSLAYI